MKLTNILSRVCRKYATLVLSAAFVSLLIISCEEATVDPMAIEKFTVGEIQIKTTSILPLLVGKDSLLKTNELPENISNKKLRWTSSNPEVASVSEEGSVKALSIGSSTITVYPTDGSDRKSSITVQVIDHIDFISAITFTNQSSSIYEAETLALTANKVPANATYQTLKWTTSNPQIATVSETGEVKGLAQGVVTITAASTDGSGIKQTIQVEIKEVIPVTGITFTTILSETLSVGETLPLQIEVSPANATVSALEWISSAPTVATVSSTGLVTALARGEATITVTSKEGVKATISVTVEAGKINDTFITGSNWIASTSGSTGVVNDGKFRITMAGAPNKRGDFRRTGGAVVHAGNYPIIAFKFNRPLPAGGNVIFDTNLGRYLQHVSNGNNRMTTITGSDGVQVHYANIADGSFGTVQNKLSTTAPTTFTTFQVVVADFPAANFPAGSTFSYEVHWIKSFKTLADLQNYIN